MLGGGGLENSTWIAVRGCRSRGENKQSSVEWTDWYVEIHAIANHVRQWLTKELPCTSLIEEDQIGHGVKSKSNNITSLRNVNQHPVVLLYYCIIGEVKPEGKAVVAVQLITFETTSRHRWYGVSPQKIRQVRDALAAARTIRYFTDRMTCTDRKLPMTGYGLSR